MSKRIPDHRGDGPVSRAILSRLRLLEKVGLESVESLLSACPVRQLPAGEVLISAGQKNDTLYLLLSGRLRVHLASLESEPVAILEAGESAGELSVMDQRPASAFVVADQDSSLLVVPQDIFWPLITASHGVARNLLVTLSQRLRSSNSSFEERIRLLLDSTAEGIYGVDNQGNCTFSNAACARMLGYRDVDELLGKDMHALVHHTRPDGSPYPVEACHMRQVLLDNKGTHVDDEVLWCKDGTSFPADYWCYPIRKDGQVVGSVTTFIDITERKQVEQRLHHMAHYDGLTNLPNRNLLIDRLEQSLARVRWHDRVLAVLFLDLDRFKVINDTLGHDAGDKLLQATAERLSKCVRDGDTVARLGGDEFAILLTDVAQTKDISPLAQTILDAFAHCFDLEGHQVFVTASMGISLYPNDAEDAASFLKNADIAMYRAKEQGGNNYRFYTADMNTRAVERLTLETALRGALERNEFFLYYQPQIDLNSGRIMGIEALVRWQHPDLGVVPPLEFIAILEEIGLIVPVGKWVLQSACQQVRAWRDAGISTPRIAVNLSARQFADPHLMVDIRQFCNDAGLDPHLLELEITESVIMKQGDSTMETLRQLHEMGIRLAVDDFGTGYSSLAYLKRFPIQTLKIDRSFVNDVTVDPDDATIVSAIISLAHALGLQVVAEGVETSDQLQFLRSRGCDAAQGYLFSKPMPADELVLLLQQEERKSA